ncbi:MAG: hypothetical protein HOK80_07580, partial [Candidatus Cloacimonetes bacterium]|nr:hypothetical protein [Candidatus Cloacimonadota bacterium]
MKTQRWFIFLLVIVVIPIFTHAQTQLSLPQKIVIDYEQDRLLVSNFGNGALLQIDANGIIEDFISDAGFVDGMDIVGDVIYGVGDNCKLYGYNLDTEQLVVDVSFPTGAGVYLS